MATVGKTVDKYTILKTLGKGTYSKVKLGYDASEGKYFAVKIHKSDDPEFTAEHKKTVMNEVKQIWELDGHPNVLKLVNFIATSTMKNASTEIPVECIIVLDYISGGELFYYVANSGAFSEPVARYYFKQMIDGLEYIHGKGFAHRDMKPDNVLVDDKFNLVIADFGFAAPVEGKAYGGMAPTGFLRTKLGTEAYMAPEIHRGEPYNGPAVDLFATAIILFIMRSGIPPFMKARPDDKFWQMISNGKVDLFWKYHSRQKPGGEAYYSPEFRDLMTRMLHPDPTKRLTIAELKTHPWVQGPVPTYADIFAEFSKRRQRNDEIAEEERKQRESSRGGGRYRGDGEAGPDERLIKDYVRLGHKDTEFFSSADPRDVRDAIENFAKTEECKFEEVAG